MKVSDFLMRQVLWMPIWIAFGLRCRSNLARYDLIVTPWGWFMQSSVVTNRLTHRHSRFGHMSRTSTVYFGHLSKCQPPSPSKHAAAVRVVIYHLPFTTRFVSPTTLSPVLSRHTTTRTRVDSDVIKLFHLHWQECTAGSRLSPKQCSEFISIRVEHLNK